MNASSLLLRAASRRAASASMARTTSVAVRSASVLAGSAAAAAAAAPPSFQGAGFKAVGLRSLWSTSPLTSTRRPTVYSFSSSTRSRSFLADYDAHVLERAALADGLGVAPQPLDAAQVTTLIDEIKAAKEGDADADRVRPLSCLVNTWDGVGGKKSNGWMDGTLRRGAHVWKK